MGADPAPVRVSIIGLGTVGEWLLEALERNRDRIRRRHGVDLRVVAIASRRDGYVYSERGIPPVEALAIRRSGGPIAELAGVRHWPTALDGLSATETDVLVEVSQSPPDGGEPGSSHIREALRRGISVATSNKWPVALAGVELAEMARRHRAGLRAESTVMSGTPVLAALTSGIGGATPLRLRGVLNATVNFICSRIASGGSYAEALAAAEAAGLAEPDPSSDVDGRDSVAKLMVLSALVFGVQLGIGDVACHGISALDEAEIEAAIGDGRRIREVATLDPGAGLRSVAAVALGPGDPLFDVDGATNAIRAEVAPIGEIAISGPGAGPAQAGQGVLSDLLALAREHAFRSKSDS